MRRQHCRCRQYAVKRQYGLFGHAAQRVGFVFILWINLDGKADMAILDDDS
jgi:hypothetical protein